MVKVVSKHQNTEISTLNIFQHFSTYVVFVFSAVSIDIDLFRHQPLHPHGSRNRHWITGFRPIGTIETCDPFTNFNDFTI